MDFKKVRDSTDNLRAHTSAISNLLHFAIRTVANPATPLRKLSRKRANTTTFFLMAE